MCLRGHLRLLMYRLDPLNVGIILTDFTLHHTKSRIGPQEARFCSEKTKNQFRLPDDLQLIFGRYQPSNPVHCNLELVFSLPKLDLRLVEICVTVACLGSCSQPPCYISSMHHGLYSNIRIDKQVIYAHWTYRNCSKSQQSGFKFEILDASLFAPTLIFDLLSSVCD